MKEKVEAAMNKIRPMLQADGGDVELVSVENGIVKVRLQGACAGCLMSQMTLKNGIERVLIAYDRDEAGEKAAASLAAKLEEEEGIACYRILFPKGMDANEYALSLQPASKSLGVVIEKAVWMGKGETKSLRLPLSKGEEGMEPSPPLAASPVLPGPSSKIQGPYLMIPYYLSGTSRKRSRAILP